MERKKSKPSNNRNTTSTENNKTKKQTKALKTDINKYNKRIPNQLLSNFNYDIYVNDFSSISINKEAKDKSLKFNINNIIGTRDYNEDRVQIFIQDKLKVFSILDGHGGDYVANQSMHMLNNILQFVDPDKLKQSFNQFFFHLIDCLDQQILKNIPDKDFSGYSSGSTLMQLYVLDNSYFIVSLGDSQCFMKVGDEEFKKIGWDHTPDNQLEIQRLKIQGRKPKFDSDYKDMRVDGLSVCGSIGDYDVGYVVNKVPQIYPFTRQRGQKVCVILTSDGILDIKDHLKQIQSGDMENFMKKNMSNFSDNFSFIQVNF